VGTTVEAEPRTSQASSGPSDSGVELPALGWTSSGGPGVRPWECSTWNIPEGNYFFFAPPGTCLMRTAVSRKIFGWDELRSGSGCFPPFQGLDRK